MIALEESFARPWPIECLDGEDMEDAVSDVEPSVPLPSTQVILTMSGRKTTDVSESRSKLRQ